MSAGSTELTMSISEVCIIIWWMHLPMAITLLILNLGWLRYYAIAFAYVSNFIWTLTHCHVSNDGSVGIFTTRFVSTNQFLLLDDLLKISSLLFFTFTAGHVSQLTSGTSAMKSFLDPSKPLSGYGLTRSTHRCLLRSAYHKFRWSMAIFCVQLLFTWHDLCDCVWIRWLFRSFPIHLSFYCFLRWVCLGCCCRLLQWQWYNEPSLLHVQFLSSLIWRSSPLSRVALHLKKCLSLACAL